MGETVAQRQQLRFPPSQAVDQPAAAAQAGNTNPGWELFRDMIRRQTSPHTQYRPSCLLLTQLVPEFLVFGGGRAAVKWVNSSRHTREDVSQP